MRLTADSYATTQKPLLMHLDSYRVNVACLATLLAQPSKPKHGQGECASAQLQTITFPQQGPDLQAAHVQAPSPGSDHVPVLVWGSTGFRVGQPRVQATVGSRGLPRAWQVFRGVQALRVADPVTVRAH